MRKILLGTALFALPLAGFSAEFYCPQGGVVTVMVVRSTELGKVICIKDRHKFRGYISLKQQPSEIIFAQCNKQKGGEK